jgi:TldD protein
MNRKLKIFLLSLIISLNGLSVFSQNNDDVLLKALEDEMSRSVSQLQLKELGKPYFVEYGVSDLESFTVSAKFGALLGSGFDNSRSGSIQVRIGDYDFDNTNLFSAGIMSSSIPLPQDDDYDAIRRDLWLATDAVYKSSIEQISAKRAFLQNNVVDEKLPDLSREKPTISLEPRQKLQVDGAKWEKIIRDLSAVFRKYPEITESSVSMIARLENRYLINNEGTRLREPSLLISVNIYAETVTTDTLKITPSRHIYSTTFDKLPTAEQLTETAEKMAQDLTRIRNAPIFEETYIGPVLFTERAAVQLFSQLLAPNFSDERLPLANRGDDGGGVFGERINRRILPPSLSITDNPNISEYKGYQVIGGYKFDAQGVPAKPIQVVENGILKSLFSTRVPTKKSPQSNGRARSGFGGAFISNLIVESKEGKSFAELKQELINNCKAQSLPYGMLFKEIDSTFFSSGNSLTPPILAYKVYVADGREELVRNLSIDEFPVRELRQILAVGNDSMTLNHLSSAGQRGTGVPYSVSAPSVLLDEIVLRKDTSTKSKPLILTHPYFDKK